VPGPPGPQGAQGIQGVPGPSAITTRGDLAVGDATGVPVRLPIGAAGQVLTAAGGTDPAWQTPAATGMTNPMTAIGDLIVGGTNGAPTRLPIYSTRSAVLFSDTADAYWQTNPWLQGISLDGSPYARLRLSPEPSGHVYDIQADAPGGAAPNQFKIANATTGTTPLAILGDRVLIESSYLNLGTHSAYWGSLLRFQPSGGYYWDVKAGGTGSSWLNQFHIGCSDGTTPLAITSDRVEVKSRHFEVGTSEYLDSALIRVTPPAGGHTYQIAAPAAGHAWGAGSFVIHDATTNRIKIQIDANGQILMDLAAQGLRPVYFGGVDTGGAGYRTVLVPNNPQ
jgi:hypothetical protein